MQIKTVTCMYIKLYIGFWDPYSQLINSTWLDTHLQLSQILIIQNLMAQSTGAVVYTDCLSGKTLTPNECPRYDTKQSDGEVPVMLELWGMQSTPSLPSLPDPLWLGAVAPDRVLSMGQIELCTYVKMNCLK